MIELLLSFAIGFSLSFLIIMFHYKKLDVSYLLTTIKEDINNLQVTANHLFEKQRK